MDIRNFLTDLDERGDGRTRFANNERVKTFLDVLWVKYTSDWLIKQKMHEIKDLDPCRQILFDFRPSFCCTDSALEKALRFRIPPGGTDLIIYLISNFIMHNRTPVEYYLGLYVERINAQDHWSFRLVGVSPDEV